MFSWVGTPRAMSDKKSYRVSPPHVSSDPMPSIFKEIPGLDQAGTRTMDASIVFSL